MNKEKLIRDIIELSQIHHNIRIDYNKAQKATDKALLTEKQLESFNTEMQIEGDMIESFKGDFEDYELTPLNDSGNRNLGKDCEIKGKVWQHGRMGATLYWEAYWKSTNSGFYFLYNEDELREMPVLELKGIYSDIKGFNLMIKKLMSDYYAELEYQAKEYKQRCIEEDKQEKYDAFIAPYNVNLYELSKEKDIRIKRCAISLIKLLKLS